MNKSILAIAMLSTISLTCSPVALADNEDFNAHCTLRNINVRIDGNSNTFQDVNIDSVILNFETRTETCEYKWWCAVPGVPMGCLIPWRSYVCKTETVQHNSNYVSEELRQLYNQNNITGDVQRAQTQGYYQASTLLHPVICKKDEDAYKTIDETVTSYTLIYNDSNGQSHDAAISGAPDATNATITINHNNISDVRYNG